MMSWAETIKKTIHIILIVSGFISYSRGPQLVGHSPLLGSGLFAIGLCEQQATAHACMCSSTCMTHVHVHTQLKLCKLSCAWACMSAHCSYSPVPLFPIQPGPKPQRLETTESQGWKIPVGFGEKIGRTNTALLTMLIWHCPARGK